ncbi:hypothetical protein DVH24_032911 [Malus domestica]|uniref:Uncharacterized protein n=1 Tax=Malus domestica TaxID=3750 RepID=A0A498IRC9_MALDO|nr:hypothetical protein DVH24_032911 [Malus domestica]
MRQHRGKSFPLLPCSGFTTSAASSYELGSEGLMGIFSDIRGYNLMLNVNKTIWHMIMVSKPAAKCGQIF